MHACSQREGDFSCSIQTPVMHSCQLYPGCCMTTTQVTRHALLVDTTVSTHFQHHSLLLRGFPHWFKFFSSAPLTCRSRSSRFSLSFTTPVVSPQGSIRWFADYPCRSSAEGLPFTLVSLLPVIQFARTPRLQPEESKGFHHLYSIHSLFKEERFKTHTGYSFAEGRAVCGTAHWLMLYCSIMIYSTNVLLSPCFRNN